MNPTASMKPPKSFPLLLPALLGAALMSSCATTPKVDPAAQTVLTQSTEKLRAASTIHATGTRVADPALLPPGSPREVVNFDLYVARPGSLAVRSTDGQGRRHLIAGGGNITLYDEKANVYTSVETEAKSIDELVDDIEAQFDVKMIISEILGADPMKSLMEDVTEVKVGGEEKVRGTLCTRLDFTQKDISWQLWIAKSDTLPRMSSITYIKKPGQPKRAVTITQWRLNEKVPAANFQFAPRKGAQQVEVIH